MAPICWWTTGAGHAGHQDGGVYDGGAAVDEVTLEADAGILLNHLAVYAQQHGLSGLEFAHGIPGTLGGAICMNAGAYGGEMRQVVTEVTALLPEGVRRFTAEEAAFGYRRSAFLIRRRWCWAPDCA